MSRAHTIYGFDLSYFTRKMEAAFDLHGLAFRRRSKTAFNARRLERGSGTRKVPVVVAPDGRFMSDTTPIIDDLDWVDPTRRLFPEGLDGVVARLVEEWLDEWFPRTVVHYRWHDPEGRRLASRSLAREALPFVPGFLRRRFEAQIAGWGIRACRALGVVNPVQQRSAEADAEVVWVALDGQLARTRYALGDRATAVDAVLLGALRGHYLVDPAPRRILDRLPRVVEWASRATAWDGAGDLPAFPEVSEFAEAVVDRMRGPYRAWLAAHSAALDRGDRVFEAAIEGQSVDFRVLRPPTPSESVRYLSDRIGEQVQGADRLRLEEWLVEQGLDGIVSL